MKKNGFTFIEILGVITLLALISTIILISVSKSLKDSKEKLYQIEMENIKSAASMWRTDNIELVPDNDIQIITLKDLQDNGYIKEDLINPKTNRQFEKDLLISIGLNNIECDENIENLLAKNNFTKLDYIKSTGTQYINLKYKAKTNTEIRLDVQFVINDNTNTSTAMNTFVGKETNNNNDAMFNVNFAGSDVAKKEILYWIDKRYGYGGEKKNKVYSSVTSRSTMIVKSVSATFQDVTIEVATKTADNTENMILLGSFNNDQNKIITFNRYDAKVYGFQIYEGTTLIKDMVPYLKNEEAGLYDLVGHKFYPSNGTDSFEYGELQ